MSEDLLQRTVAQLESAQPGQYVLEQRIPARQVTGYNFLHDGIAEVRLTGRVLARVCDHSNIPQGVIGAWHRPKDGLTVVLQVETDPRNFSLWTDDDVASTRDLLGLPAVDA